jgi:hypothetical protein
MDLAESIARQARELFGHLPAGEIGDDEKLFFTLDDAGVLAVYVPASNWNYTLHKGQAYRYQMRPDGMTQIAVFERGKVVEYFDVDLEEPKWKNAKRAD